MVSVSGFLQEENNCVMKNVDFYRNLFCRPDWNIETILEADEIIGQIAKEYLGLDTYPNQFEIVTSEQMLDAYSLVGLPISYHHWKFGKDFVVNQNNYKKGRMGLAYELVINSNPCISYNMEDNSTCLTLLVLAHASYGHNHFFKNNYLFKQWTNADSIVDYLLFKPFTFIFWGNGFRFFVFINSVIHQSVTSIQHQFHFLIAVFFFTFRYILSRKQ